MVTGARRRRREDTDAWADTVIQAPRDHVPGIRQRRRARLTRTYVWVAVYALPLLLFLNVVFVAEAIQAREPEAQPRQPNSLDETTLEARAVAVSTVETWLATEPQPLPGGRVQSWDRAVDVSGAVPPEESDDGQPVPRVRIQQHRLTLAAGQALCTAEVAVAIDPATGPQVITGPSLTAATPSADDTYTGDAWPGQLPVPVSDDVENAVLRWADAYLGDDPETLHLTVGDPDPDHAYLPLVGATLRAAEVTDATITASQLEDDGEIPDHPAQVVVRAALEIAWPSASDPPASDDETDGAVATYDLLVMGADTASPVVVAWGGPGSGTSLRPYENAVTGRAVVVEPPGQAPSDGAGELG